ncbi:MAG: DUF4253 domain-containing protein [Nitrospirota bacterium]
MTGKFICSSLAGLLLVSCTPEKQSEQKTPSPLVIVKSKNPILSPEQKKELRFSSDIIELVERDADAKAEPFFATVVMKTENLKGEKGFESRKLAGFSVRTTKTEELVKSLRSTLRSRGYLIFKSHRGYGTVPDTVTVIQGRTSYDIVKMQGTEAIGFDLSTQTIIAWLKERQKESSFVITGAGPDWIEAQFIKLPHDLTIFAKKIIEFSPDVLTRDIKTLDNLIEHIEKKKGFFLSWD